MRGAFRSGGGPAGLSADYEAAIARLVLAMAEDEARSPLVIEDSGGNTKFEVTAAGVPSVGGISDMVQVLVGDLTTALTTGDGKAWFVVPQAWNGKKLKRVEASLTVAQSTSGIPTVQVANVTQGWDLLTTKLTIDADEWNSSTATAAAIDTASSHDVLTTGDRLRFDIDVAGTGAKGLFVTLSVGP